MTQTQQDPTAWWNNPNTTVIQEEPGDDLLLIATYGATIDKWGITSIAWRDRDLRVTYYEVGGEREYHRTLKAGHPLIEQIIALYPHAI